MIIKPEEIWILLKSKLKTENQKIAHVGCTNYTLIEYVFFSEIKKPELNFKEHVIYFCTKVMRLCSCQ